MTARNDPKAFTASAIAAVSGARDGDWVHGFAGVVDGRKHDGRSMQIDSNMPHDTAPCLVGYG